ncbi:MAG: prepilin peptidase [Acidobacteria bacterium]|nr:MAG: prepilin peptidase [Acidobacteriota bacterium]
MFQRCVEKLSAFFPGCSACFFPSAFLSRRTIISRMPWGIHFFVVLFGLIIGSFLNVCIHRIPRGQSVVRPRSRCPKCDHAIRAWENIPLISYAVLRGRCSKCGVRISWVYPMVEALTAGTFYLLFLKYGLSTAFLFNAFFFGVLIALTFIDLHHRILPDVLTISATIVGFLLVPLQSAEFFTKPATSGLADVITTRYFESFLGIVLGGGLLWVAARLYLAVKKVEGMGLGDVKMLMAVGAFLGWRFAWLTVFLGSLVGAIVGLVFIYSSGRDKRYELPFGTFLGFAAIAATLWGEKLIDWYAGLL